MSGKLVRLELENFQAHAKFVVDLDPGVNVIIGGNDRGKSTIFRAIRWVTFNRPSGSDVIRWNKKKCHVRLTTGTHEVVRGKEAKNYYELDGKRRDAVGTSVPQDVQDALGLDQINFQRQIDGPFWFSLTAGAVAEEMNRIVDLSIIDRSLDKASSLAKQAASEVKVLNELLITAQARVGRLKWVVDAKASLQTIVSREQDALRSLAEYESLSRLIEQIEEATEATPEPPDLSSLAPLAGRMSEIDSELTSLQRLIAQIESEEADTCSLTKKIEAAKAEVEKLRPEICPTCGREMTERS